MIIAIRQLEVFRVLFVADGAIRCEHALVKMLDNAGIGGFNCVKIGASELEEQQRSFVQRLFPI